MVFLLASRVPALDNFIYPKNFAAIVNHANAWRFPRQTWILSFLFTTFMIPGPEVWKKMVEKGTNDEDSVWVALGNAFPETQTLVLARATEGDWERFFRRYLTACWGEIQIVCRTKHLSLNDAEEVLQELVLRLMKTGESRQKGTKGLLGNLPARYLQEREMGAKKARFRTVLKRVIENLIHEQVRARHRSSVSLEDQDSELAIWLDESVDRILDRQWIASALDQASRRLWDESFTASTQGKKRWFHVLYYTLVREQKAEAIAERFGIDRTNIAGLLAQSRRRFIELLQEITGYDDVEELRNQVAHQAQSLLDSLERVFQEAGGGRD